MRSQTGSAEHARFKQTNADVGSFDGGYGSAYLARQVSQKFAREIFFLGDEYPAADAHRMGMVNAIVPQESLESVALEWAAKVNGKSPTAQRTLKLAFNAVDDGMVGQQVFAGEATSVLLILRVCAVHRGSSGLQSAQSPERTASADCMMPAAALRTLT